jgi:hypothetical protein
MQQQLSTLEVLEGALRHLGNPRTKWEFSDWTSCTCGHIYTAALGKKSRAEARVWKDAKDGIYIDVIKQVARALGWNGSTSEVEGLFSSNPEATAAASYVSEYTQRVAEGPDWDPDEDDEVNPERIDAIEVISQAITVIRQEEEAARQALLQTTAEIIQEDFLRIEADKDSEIIAHFDQVVTRETA